MPARMEPQPLVLYEWCATVHCKARAHCRTCRARTVAGAAWRTAIAAKFAAPTGWECPHGVPWDVGAALHTRLLRIARLGDKVERMTRAAGIRPCGGCRKRKAVLNGDP